MDPKRVSSVEYFYGQQLRLVYAIYAQDPKNLASYQNIYRHDGSLLMRISGENPDSLAFFYGTSCFRLTMSQDDMVIYDHLLKKNIKENTCEKTETSKSGA
jgi:hypothetical protein